MCCSKLQDYVYVQSMRGAKNKSEFYTFEFLPSPINLCHFCPSILNMASTNICFKFLGENFPLEPALISAVTMSKCLQNHLKIFRWLLSCCYVGRSRIMRKVFWKRDFNPEMIFRILSGCVLLDNFLFLYEFDKSKLQKEIPRIYEIDIENSNNSENMIFSIFWHYRSQ